MYVENIYNYFYDFRRPVKYATMEIEIAIENSRSLKLRQTLRVQMSPCSANQTKSRDMWQVVCGSGWMNMIYTAS